MSWLSHPWLTVRVQIALGAIFIAAALPKIVDPPTFAQMIYNYRIVPGWAVNPLALFLPWLEILTGLALVLGVLRRAAASIIGAMLIVFIIGIGINLARNNPIDCGCFEQNPVPKTDAQLFTDMKWVIARDLGMLLMVAQILWATGAERRVRDESMALAARASHVAARS